MACIPLYLQIVKGASPTRAGLLILPMVAGIMLASLVAGQLTSRTGRYKIFPVIGSVFMVAGLLLMTQVGADTPLWQTDLFMAVFGAGLGLNMQSIVLAMQNAVEPRDMGVATSAVTFFRQVGGSMGTAVFLSILFSTAGGEIASAYAKAATTPEFRQAAAAHPGQLAQIKGGGNLNDTSFVHSLDPVLAHPFKVGFSNAMDTVFLVGALVLVLAIVLSLMLKEVPLRTMSGQQARAAADAAGSGGPVDVPSAAATTTVAPDLSRQAGPCHLAPGEADAHDEAASTGRHRSP
jgi:MFS family permease